MPHYWSVFKVIVWREMLRFYQQKQRFWGALVRPLIWLFAFAVGFRSALGLSIEPPYETYILYEMYIIPGLIGMIQLFNGMQSSLSMVYDREMGSMRILLTTPLPREFLLLSKLVASVIVSIIQVYLFLFIAYVFGVEFPLSGLISILPVLFLTGLFLGAIGLLISSLIDQLENFAGVMNFIIFPAFFLSTALYPLWKIKESSMTLYYICLANPFTYVVETIRFALYQQINITALSVVIVSCVVVLFVTFLIFKNNRGFRL